MCFSSLYLEWKKPICNTRKSTHVCVGVHSFFSMQLARWVRALISCSLRRVFSLSPKTDAIRWLLICEIGQNSCLLQEEAIAVNSSLFLRDSTVQSSKEISSTLAPLWLSGKKLKPIYQILCGSRNMFSTIRNQLMG